MNLFIKQIHRHRKQTYGYQMGKVRGGAVNYEHRINKYTLLYTSSPNDSDSKKKNLPAVQETWVQSLGQEDPLEKGMATHSSILAWRIP